jgi:hypothetical protein
MAESKECTEAFEPNPDLKNIQDAFDILEQAFEEVAHNLKSGDELTALRIIADAECYVLEGRNG